MFTGLVQATGRLVKADPTPAGRRLVVAPEGWDHRPGPGESICVSGVCLTVAGGGGPELTFDVVPETLSKTTLGGLAAGDRVNLEASCTAATLLGGHLVQGHADGLGSVARVDREGEWRVRIVLPDALMEYVVPKGSIAVDGVSLTVAAVSTAGRWFEVALIPTTLRVTTLVGLRPGSACNVECDQVAKTIVHWLKHYGAARPGGVAPSGGAV